MALASIARWNDDERTGCVVSALLADRPKEQARKTTQATTSDDQNVSVVRGLDEHSDHLSFDNMGLDLDVVGIDAFKGSLEDVVGFLVERRAYLLHRCRGLGYSKRLVGGDREYERNRPGVHDQDFRPAKTCLTESPAERFRRAF